MTRHGVPRLYGVDPDAVMRDDALIEALARREPLGDADEVVSLLADWCAAIDNAPTGGPSAIAVPSAAPVASPADACALRRSGRRRYVGLRRSAAAVTLLGLSLGGVTAAEQARPGSPFWPLTRMLDQDRARSLTAFYQADQRLDHAVEALENGQVGTARQEVAQARKALTEVRPRDGRDLLAARLDDLQRRLGLAEQPGGAAPTTPDAASVPGGTQNDSDADQRGGVAGSPAPSAAPTTASDDDDSDWSTDPGREPADEDERGRSNKEPLQNAADGRRKTGPGGRSDNRSGARATEAPVQVPVSAPPVVPASRSASPETSDQVTADGQPSSITAAIAPSAKPRAYSQDT